MFQLTDPQTEEWTGNNSVVVCLQRERFSSPGQCTSTKEPAQRDQI